MKKVLIDLNIVLDMLNMREDHESAVEIIDKCIKRELKGYICSHELTTLSYFMEKHKYNKKKRIYIINKMLDIFSITPSTENILREALYSEISDYEDAVIEISAIKEGIEYIVTRNLKDFKKSKIKVCSAREVIAILNNGVYSDC